MDSESFPAMYSGTCGELVSSVGGIPCMAECIGSMVDGEGEGTCQLTFV